MHLPEQWTEFDQLCGSKPFKAFCKSPLPSPDQRVICQACGLEVDESGHHRESYTGATSCNGMHHHVTQLLTVKTDPEELHHGPAWTAPYVWETNYL